MALSDEEKQAYLDQIRPQHEAAVDAVFLEQFGRTFNDHDMRQARLAHGQQNGSSRPQDDFEHVRREFPGLFGDEDA